MNSIDMAVRRNCLLGCGDCLYLRSETWVLTLSLLLEAYEKYFFSPSARLWNAIL